MSRARPAGPRRVRGPGRPGAADRGRAAVPAAAPSPPRRRAAGPPAPRIRRPGGPALPVAQSSFVGRDRELAELVGLLGSARLITLIGPGGAGKTRLAVEAVRRAAPAAGHVHPAGARAPARVADHRAWPPACACRTSPGCRCSSPSPPPWPSAPRLIVLDGAEHLRDEVAALVSHAARRGTGAAHRGHQPGGARRARRGVLDGAAAGLPVRRRRGGRHRGVRRGAAVHRRAQERLPGFTVADVPPRAIAELCRRLDGLPLAIELIAGWVGTLSVREILQQRAVLLDQDAPGAAPRGRRRLVDVVRASYDLLRPEEQRLLAGAQRVRRAVHGGRRAGGQRPRGPAAGRT